MASNLPNELESFHEFLGTQIQLGNKQLTPEESLELWRAQSASSPEDIEAIKEGYADLLAGRVHPFEEVIEEIQRKHGL